MTLGNSGRFNLEPTRQIETGGAELGLQMPDLHVPEGAGQIEVVGSTGNIADVNGYNAVLGVVKSINDGRRKRNRLELPSIGEHIEQVQAWRDGGNAADVEGLYANEDHPLVVFPAIPGPITVDETLRAIDESSPRGLRLSPGILALLKSKELFRTKDITGFDSECDAPIVAETGYDDLREGPASRQREALDEARATNSGIEIASLIVTALLNNLDPTSHWKENSTRVGSSDGRFGAHAFGRGGGSVVFPSSTGDKTAARWIVRLG